MAASVKKQPNLQKSKLSHNQLIHRIGIKNGHLFY